VDIDSFPHRVIRLTLDTRQRYEAFRARYEDAEPELDSKHLAGFLDRGARWQEIVADADASATLGFHLLAFRSDAPDEPGGRSRAVHGLPDWQPHHRGADIPRRPIWRC
jgi:hypothetical protein